MPHPNSTTSRLTLKVPTLDDLQRIHSIHSDPRTWEHYPQLRPRDISSTQRMLERYMREWENGLGPWVVYLHDEVIGYGGCSYKSDPPHWTLGYRFSPDHTGKGYATEMALEAVRAAKEVKDVPILAFLVAHNTASQRVAQKVGLDVLVHDGPDQGNPNPGVRRLVYADRELGEEFKSLWEGEWPPKKKDLKEGKVEA